MNSKPDFFSRCLHGTATPADWRLLDDHIATDPAVARHWCEAVRLDAELSRLLTPPRAAKTFARARPAALAATAAAVAAGFILALPSVEPPALPRVSATPLPLPAMPPPPAELSAPAAPDAGPKVAQVIPKFSRVITEERVMALTFEDGPMEANTSRLLRMLKEAGVKATFFPMGINLERFPHLAKQMVAEGHELGNHTWTHPKLSTLPEEKFRAEIERSRDKLRELTGQPPVYFRPPYGAITPAQVDFVARTYGCSTVFWSVDPMDWKDRDAQKTEAAVLAQARPGAIVLLHDIHRTTIDAVPGILKSLKAGGWRLVTVSELLRLGTPASTDGEK
jgi:peptidoglycan-N-acetylglucosamine deacetylase